MRRTRFLSLVVALLVLPAAWAVPAPGLLDDAGSGADAGDSPDAAMQLAYGDYTANLTPADRDWFGFPAPVAPSCSSVRVVSSHAMRVGVMAGSFSLLAPVDESGLFATTLAVPPGALRLGALPDESPWDAVSVGPYLFHASVAPATIIGDAKANDAGATLPTARAVPAACFRGAFQHDGPDVDVFRFQANLSERIVASLAAVDGVGQFEVLNAAGGVMSGPHPSGYAVELAAPATGTYYLRLTGVDTVATTDYVAAVRVGPDPGSSCRPYCLGLL